MKYQQVYALLILVQEKIKTYKNLRPTTWVKERKDKQDQKGSLRIICFGLTFLFKWLKFLLPLSSSCTHVMWMYSQQDMKQVLKIYIIERMNNQRI